MMVHFKTRRYIGRHRVDANLFDFDLPDSLIRSTYM